MCRSLPRLFRKLMMRKLWRSCQPRGSLGKSEKLSTKGKSLAKWKVVKIYVFFGKPQKMNCLFCARRIYILTSFRPVWIDIHHETEMFAEVCKCRPAFKGEFLFEIWVFCLQTQSPNLFLGLPAAFYFPFDTFVAWDAEKQLFLALKNLVNLHQHWLCWNQGICQYLLPFSIVWGFLEHICKMLPNSCKKIIVLNMHSQNPPSMASLIQFMTINILVQVLPSKDCFIHGCNTLGGKGFGFAQKLQQQSTKVLHIFVSFSFCLWFQNIYQLTLLGGFACC